MHTPLDFIIYLNTRAFFLIFSETALCLEVIEGVEERVELS